MAEPTQAGFVHVLENNLPQPARMTAEPIKHYCQTPLLRVSDQSVCSFPTATNKSPQTPTSFRAQCRYLTVLFTYRTALVGPLLRVSRG